MTIRALVSASGAFSPAWAEDNAERGTKVHRITLANGTISIAFSGRFNLGNHGVALVAWTGPKSGVRPSTADYEQIYNGSLDPSGLSYQDFAFSISLSGSGTTTIWIGQANHVLHLSDAYDVPAPLYQFEVSVGSAQTGPSAPAPPSQPDRPEAPAVASGDPAPASTLSDLRLEPSELGENGIYAAWESSESVFPRAVSGGNQVLLSNRGRSPDPEGEVSRYLFSGLHKDDQPYIARVRLNNDSSGNYRLRLLFDGTSGHGHFDPGPRIKPECAEDGRLAIVCRVEKAGERRSLSLAADVVTHGELIATMSAAEEASFDALATWSGKPSWWRISIEDRIGSAVLTGGPYLPSRRTSDNPAIGFENWLADAQDATSPSTSGWRTAVNGLAYDAWTPESLDNAYVEVSLWRDRRWPELIGCAGHDMGTQKYDLALQWQDGSAWRTADVIRPLTDAPFGKCYSQEALPESRSWRLRICPRFDSSGQIPKVGALHMGPALEVPRRLWDGFAPLQWQEDVRVQANTTTSGLFVGRSAVSRKLEGSLEVSQIPAEWARNPYVEQFMRASQLSPFWLFWRPRSYPLEGWYCWLPQGQAPRMRNDQGGTVAFALQLEAMAA